MANVDQAKDSYVRNSDAESYTDGLENFVEASDEDNLEDAWTAAVQDGESYTGGVEDFLESDGGVDSANVTEDYDWQDEALSASGDFATNAQNAGDDYEEMTNENNSDKWFRRYAAAYGSEEE